jgi:ATP/maltotriose-dependent transcriptional regulator MalT
MSQLSPGAPAVSVFPHIALIAGASTLPDAIYEALRSGLARSDYSPPERVCLAASAGLAAAVRRDASVARPALAALASARGLAVLGWGYVAVPTSVDRVRGTLTATFGDFDEGVRHFEVALDFCRDAGYRPELAWICHDYAAALIGRGKTRDRPRIRELLDLSEPIAAQLGMTPLANMLAAQRSSVAAPRRGHTEYPDGLTDREVEVLRLVAAGKSNGPSSSAKTR